MQPSAEKRIYAQFTKIKAPFLQPLVKTLDVFGVKPDLLSYLGVGLMLWFVFVAGSNPVLGFWLIVSRGLLDSIDGPLARYQKNGSDRGKFTDALMDQLGFLLFMCGLVKADLVSSLPALVLAYSTLLVTVLMVVKKNLNKNSDWLIKAFAGAFPHTIIYICYGLYGVFAFADHNYFRKVFIVFSGLMVAKAISDYVIIRSTKFNN